MLVPARPRLRARELPPRAVKGERRGHPRVELDRFPRRRPRSRRPFARVLGLRYELDGAGSAWCSTNAPAGATNRNINRILLHHPANRALAKHFVYTADRTPEDIADEIIRATAASPIGVGP